MSFLNFGLSKRHKIIVTSAILTLALISTWFVPISFYITYKYWFMGGLAVLAYLLSFWSLMEGINKVKATILMILPTLFTVAVANYFFLLPMRWLAIPVSLVYGLIFYVLLLSQNVFNVASIRTIPLYRVASTTVFVLTLLTSFILFDVIYSLNLLFVWNGLLVFLLTFLLVIQVLWSIEMEQVSSAVLIYTLVLSLVVGEVALMLSFWPIYHPMASLILSTVLFITLGITTHTFRERLSRGVVWEYIGWGVLIFMVATITTSWRG